MKRILLLLIVFGLCACSESLETFRAADADKVSVKAYLIRQDDSTRERRKTDTLLPSDSIVLLAVIEPTRSIRMTEFHWQIDQGKTYSEFSHRASVEEPGEHLARFILLDRFADTLTDSVRFWVAPVPVLDTESWIPRSGTVEVPPDSLLSFAWNATVENSLAQTEYAFTLKCGAEHLLDTVLAENHLTLPQKLPELSHCRFTVSASDDFGRTSDQNIYSEFFTGTSEKSSTGTLVAKIKSPVSDSLRILMLSATGDVLENNRLHFDIYDSAFSFYGMEAGKYRLFLQSVLHPDYMTDTLDFLIRKGKVSVLSDVSLRDTVPPQIRSMDLKTDTLDWKDTLRFAVREKGLPISAAKIQIVFDGEKISDWTFDDSILSVSTESLKRSFSVHPLSISAADPAGNKAVQTFAIAPGKSCVRTLSDTTVSDEKSISIPIENACAHLFPKRFFWDIDSDGNWDGESSFDSTRTAARSFALSLFPEPSSRVHVAILYASGEEYGASFTLKIGDGSK